MYIIVQYITHATFQTYPVFDGLILLLSFCHLSCQTASNITGSHGGTQKCHIQRYL